MIREMGKCRGCRKKMLQGGGKLQRVMFAHNKEKRGAGVRLCFASEGARNGNLETM